MKPQQIRFCQQESPWGTGEWLRRECGCQGKGLFLRGTGVPVPMQRVPSPHPFWARGRWWRGNRGQEWKKKKKGSVGVGGCPLEEESEVRGTHPWCCTHSLAAQLAL